MRYVYVSENHLWQVPKDRQINNCREIFSRYTPCAVHSHSACTRYATVIDSTILTHVSENGQRRFQNL